MNTNATTLVNLGETIALPAGRYIDLPTGCGWCGQGQGMAAQWAVRNDNGKYSVGPGRWAVGSTDGSHKMTVENWVVAHVRVGDLTLTIATME